MGQVIQGGRGGDGGDGGSVIIGPGSGGEDGADGEDGTISYGRAGGVDWFRWGILAALVGSGSVCGAYHVGSAIDRAAERCAPAVVEAK